MKKLAIILAALLSAPALADDGGKATFYNTTGSKSVKASPGRLVLVQAQGGTSPAVQFFDDADATCDTNAQTGTITLTADAAPMEFGWDNAVGICMLITGTSPEITVVTK